jgi:transcriptional regulator with PAS, ATPase and Fis domain
MKFRLAAGRREVAAPVELAAWFAELWQIERAFVHIYNNILGTSPCIARLRAAVWSSIFTGDLRRYRTGLFARMHEIPTLITGPSGTGKELVAQAIARSAHVPFDPGKQRFVQNPRELFFALNLAALSPGLVESELYGHRRGAFTGALADHAGWFEVGPEGGSVFLDEIGETDPGLQVKLLRVLQTRLFQRLGESRPRRFVGKIIAATNRNLRDAVQAGRFREDFYYRLCSDVVTTPSLRQQLDEAPGDMDRLVRAAARRWVGAAEAESLTAGVLGWIAKRLGPDYPWPGNFRELEQCVCNVLVRGCYEPLPAPARDLAGGLAADLEASRLTAEQLLRRYCTLVYTRTGNLQATARQLDLDWRTVRAKLAPVAHGGSSTVLDRELR